MASELEDVRKDQEGPAGGAQLENDLADHAVGEERDRALAAAPNERDPQEHQHVGQVADLVEAPLESSTPPIASIRNRSNRSATRARRPPARVTAAAAARSARDTRRRPRSAMSSSPIQWRASLRSGRSRLRAGLVSRAERATAASESD